MRCVAVLVDSFELLQKFASTVGYSVEIDKETQQIYVVGTEDAITFDADDIENVVKFLQEHNND